MNRKNPWHTCHRKARDAALAGAGVASCPYTHPSWRSAWLRTYTEVSQPGLFDESKPKAKQKQNKSKTRKSLAPFRKMALLFRAFFPQ